MSEEEIEFTEGRKKRLSSVKVPERKIRDCKIHFVYKGPSIVVGKTKNCWFSEIQTLLEF